METHMINAFHLRKHFPALRQLGKITYQHKVNRLNVTIGSALDLFGGPMNYEETVKFIAK